MHTSQIKVQSNQIHTAIYIQLLLYCNPVHFLCTPRAISNSEMQRWPFVAPAHSMRSCPVYLMEINRWMCFKKKLIIFLKDDKELIRVREPPIG